MAAPRVEFYGTFKKVADPGSNQLQATGEFEHRWRVRAGNGEIVASGEAYTRAEDAERGFLDAASAVITAKDRMLLARAQAVVDASEGTVRPDLPIELQKPHPANAGGDPDPLDFGEPPKP